ncbi:AAEL014875-PA [Aedes aegypti]|uniref:AAEL014875-PA n=1 Tax=Aedes aegypti TaxID=7159 RepID=Q16F74_AEDAE|nr:AAEL014875-PA [Aedes aegypti]
MLLFDYGYCSSIQRSALELRVTTLSRHGFSHEISVSSLAMFNGMCESSPRMLSSNTVRV